MDSSPDAESASRVLTGTVSLAGLTTTSVPIPPVALDRSVLFLSATTVSIAPQDGQVGGRLIDASHLELHREQPSASGRVVWSILELGAGATVQRGTESSDSGVINVLSIRIDPVPLDRSFPLVSFSKAGFSYDQCDWVFARLVATDRLEIGVSANSADGVFDWQVVTIDDARVLQGEAAMTSTDTAKVVTIAPVPVDRSFLLASWGVTVATSLIGPHAIEATLSSSTSVSFQRLATGSPIALVYQVVTLPSGFRVEQGEATVAAGTSRVEVALPGADPARTIALLTGNQRSGASDLLADGSHDQVGEIWYTARVIAGPSLVLERGSSQNRGLAGWFVIEVP